MAVATFTDGEVPRTRSGLDWLQMAQWVAPKREGEYAWFWSKLAQMKKEAADNKAPVFEEVCGQRVIMQPYGVQRFEYVFQAGQWRVQAHARPTGRESSLPNFLVTCSGFDLLNNGPDVLVGSLRDFVKEVGGEERRETVSRVDITCDVGVPLAYWVECFNEGRFVSRCDKLKPYVDLKSRRVETMHFGLGEIQLRGYDKELELRQKREFETLKALRERVGEGFSRIEFQLRRPALGGKFKVEDYNSLVERGRRIATYCARDWFRFTEEANKGKHRKRLGYDAAWREVAESLEGVFSEEARNTSIEAQLTRGDVSALLGQILGLSCKVVGHACGDLKKGIKEVLLEALALTSEHVMSIEKAKSQGFFQKYFVAYQMHQIKRQMNSKTPDIDAAKKKLARDGFEVQHLLPNDSSGLKEEFHDWDEFLRKFG